VDRSGRLAAAIGVGFVLLVFLVELAAILILNAGHFTYTLDDAYIHLALAERIHGGHYGVNAGELAAPSSSIVWPFLLAPLAPWAVGEYLPLLINLGAALGTAFILNALLTRSLSRDRSAGSPYLQPFVLVLLLLCTDTLGLVFTGMEHSLQVFLSAAVLLGLVREAETRTVPKWLIAALVAGPLVRYENLALSVGGLLFLLARGHRRSAALAAAIILLTVGAFSGFLVHLGLGPVPASVVDKSPIVSHGGVTGAVQAIRRNLAEPRGIMLVIAMLGLASAAASRSTRPEERLLAGTIALVVAAHLAAGRIGWYSRYDVSISAVTLLAILYVARDGLARWIEQTKAVIAAALAVLWSAAIGGYYVVGLIHVPLGASNIEEQQFQMHRFATEYYRAPVAVNDLGYVAFRNPGYVLDLMGLASPELQGLAEEPTDLSWMNDATRRHGVELAMVYDSWFPKRPPNWRKVGELRLGRKRVTVAGDTVAFYGLTGSGYRRGVEAAKSFAGTLPRGARFVFTE